MELKCTVASRRKPVLFKHPKKRLLAPEQSVAGLFQVPYLLAARFCQVLDYTILQSRRA